MNDPILVVREEVQGGGGGVVKYFAVDGGPQLPEGIQIVDDFTIGGVPNLVMTGNHGAHFFQVIPFAVKFIGVTPDVHQLAGNPPGMFPVVRCHELFEQFFQLGIGVVAGGVPAKVIHRQTKAFGGNGGPGVADAAAADGIHLTGGFGQAERIGHTFNGLVENAFQNPAVLGDLVSHLTQGKVLQMGMGQGVDSGFVTGVQGGHFVSRDPVTLADDAAVEVEGAFQTVLVQYLNHGPILPDTIVVAQGQGFGFETGITDKCFSKHGKFSFRFFLF